MNVLEYIQCEIANARRTIDGTVKKLTDNLLNWAPPGTANTISATMLHFIHSEDHFVQNIIQGKPSIWESGDWSEKTGIAKPPHMGEDWSEFKRMHISIQPLLDYKDAVWFATDTYLSTLTQEELDRKVKFASGERTVAEMLILAVSHSLSHAGEIAALKGIQGAKGLPI